MARFGTTVFPRIRIGIGAGRYIYLPVLTSTQRSALSASAGFLIYNSTTTQLENYNGSAWVAVGKLYGDATFLPLAGGTMTGNIAMAGAQTVDGVDISAHAIDYGLHTKIIRKTADETVNNSSTLQNDDELLFAIAANEVWVFTLFMYSNSSATADFKVTFTGPSGAIIAWVSLASNAANETWITGHSATESQDIRGLGGAGLPGMFQGLVVCGATAGNLQFQWAQNVAEVSDTKILANSCIMATRLA